MLVRSDIHRSIAKMTIDLHRAMAQRAHAGDIYGLAEREYQVQYEFYGDVGTLPVEAQITIPFDLIFVGDPGNQRDSQLDRPQARFATELLSGPPGIILYAHIASWTQDDSFNFVGAIVTVGAHCPAFLAGETPPTTSFKGLLHASFQGWAAINDPDGPLDAGGNIDTAGLSY